MTTSFKGPRTVVIDQLGDMTRAKLLGSGEKYPDMQGLSPLKAFKRVNEKFFEKATEAAERMEKNGNTAEELRKLDELLKGKKK
jgi:hypothetical protein